MPVEPVTAAAPPHPALLLSEPWRAALELGGALASQPWLALAPRGNGQPVLVLPGLGADDGYTAPLRSFLRWRGFDPQPWGGGRNLGDWGALERVVLPALRDLHARSGQPVALVGASMGGLYARAAARRLPRLVRCVVTLASPVHGPHHANHVWPLFERATGQPAQALSVPPPPVPSTSVYSRADGLGDWRPCLQPPAPTHENVEVPASHLGMAWHPAVLLMLADRLAQPPQDWRPYAWPGAGRPADPAWAPDAARAAPG
ncbi:MAG: hypothetical protein NDI68_06015 [Arenimonas sp.]|nr:hypothetical protein [Arenimonas sp.]